MMRTLFWGALGIYCVYRFLSGAGLIGNRPIPADTEEVQTQETRLDEYSDDVVSLDIVCDIIKKKINPNLPTYEVKLIGMYVLFCSEEYELDPYLVLGVIHAESSARFWVNNKGALGLMQIKKSVWYEELKASGMIADEGDLYRIPTAIKCGCWILHRYLVEAGYDIDVALKLYSGGAGERYMKKAKSFIKR